MLDFGKKPLLFTLILLLVTPAFSGCITQKEDEGVIGDGVDVIPLKERWLHEWNMTGDHSHVRNAGPYHALNVQEAMIDVDLPLGEGGAAFSGDAQVHLSYWLPSNTEDGERVPVIAIISPYFSYGSTDPSNPTNIVGSARGVFIFENFVPHGYAFAQVSVFGTEESTHCFDYRGAGEQLGIDAAVTWLGEQEWSNGNVGLYGKSYEGATQWEAALFGNPHLKTIVPMSGTTSTYHLLYKNGSAESRSLAMHMSYFTEVVDGDEDDIDNVCPDVVAGLFQGPFTYGAGELDQDLVNYWEERDYRARSVSNYRGSVYIIQGLQDWNVDPHMVIPWLQDLQTAGIEVRAMLGQWAHHYPDQWYRMEDLETGYGGEAYPSMVRWDWAEDLKEWFDFYLKNEGERPELHIQVQDNMGAWRLESTYPPLDSDWLSWSLLDAERTSGGTVVGGGFAGNILSVEYEFPAVNAEARIAGLPTFHVRVIPSGDGGQVFATLLDSVTGLRLGHATMDVRYWHGGDQPQTVLPGQQLVMKMEFQTIDAVIPAGHGLRLVLTTTGEDYLPPAVDMPVTIVESEQSILSLPIIKRNDEAFFQQPLWDNEEE